jgi:hypothetical protein
MRGRVVVWSVELAAAARIRDYLPITWEVDVVARQEDLERIAWAACLVVAIPVGARPLINWKAVEGLVSHSDFVVPLVIAGNPTSDALRLAKTVSPSDIVWDYELATRLASAVARVRVRREQQATRQLLMRVNSLAPALLRAVSFLADSDRSTFSVADLARACFCHRATLAREWKTVRQSGIQLPPTIEEYLDWNLVLSCGAHARADRKWSSVATELGVSLQRMTRQCRRLAGLRLAQISERNGLAAFDHFEDRVITPLEQSVCATKR